MVSTAVLYLVLIVFNGNVVLGERGEMHDINSEGTSHLSSERVIDEVFKETFQNVTKENYLSRQKRWWAHPKILRILVPYELNIKGIEDIKLLREAMDEWEKATCVRFLDIKRVPPGLSTHAKFPVHIDDSDSICDSSFAITKKEGAFIKIGPSCNKKNDFIRAFGHVFGLTYEISKIGATDFVTVNQENAIKEIGPIGTSPLGRGYDYASVMHPPGLWNSKNGLLTISTKDIRHQGILGRARKISVQDMKVVAEKLGCPDYWSLIVCYLKENPCRNGGYMGPECRCLCPPGVYGINCTIIMFEDPYSPYMPKCSQEIKESTQIMTPSGEYSTNIPYDTWCVWSIFAPEDKRVRLEFQYFDLSSKDNCTDSFLEIREKDKTFGKMYCNTDLENGTHVSENNELYLYMDVKNEISQGFEIDVCFVTSDDETCSSAPELQSNMIIILLTFSIALARII